jgi:hypothetical protein
MAGESAGVHTESWFKGTSFLTTLGRTPSVQISFGLALVLTAGCVTPGTSDYSYGPPDQSPVLNETLVDEPFEHVWDRLVGQLAKSFFVINNIEKESRLINLSFSTSDPGAFIDCGTSTRTFSFRGDHQTYKYNVASSATFKIAAKWGPARNLPLVSEVIRTTKLDGRANVYVAPRGSQTQVTVNAIYAFSFTAEGTAYGYNAFGTLIQQERIPAETSSLSFTTTQPGSAPWLEHGASISCRSLGNFEQQVLKYAGG